MATAEDWQNELQRWLGPFLSHLGHKARRRMCPLYVAGLIGPGERKSVQPMASRTPAADYDQLHHFVGAGIWDEAPLERELIVQADRLVGGADAVLVIDDTALPKKGKHSVGVAPQYATVLGKQANCQTLVSLTLARREVPVPLALRLYLPEVWTEDPARLAKAGVPEPVQRHRSKSAIALAELDRVLGAEVRFGVVLADAAYGSSSGFRHALSERGLTWAVGIPRTQKVYSLEVELTWPVAPRGHPQQRPAPARARGPSQTSGLLRRTRCSAFKDGGPSHGGVVPRARSEPRSRRCGFASRTAPRPALENGRTSTSQARRRSGSWASAVRQASTSTTSRTCRPRRR
jgi:SRSO17 transposase